MHTQPSHPNPTRRPIREQDIAKEIVGVEDDTNPVKKLYDGAFRAGIGRWICSLAVVGLSAGIISRHPGPRMMGAAGYNLAVGALHVFLFGPRVKPIGLNNPRPPTWYIAILALSTVMWIAAFVTMFVIRDSGNSYDVFRIQERRLGSMRELGGGTLELLRNMTIAVGCFGIVALVFGLYQWIVVYKLTKTKFSKQQLHEGYRKVHKLPEPKKESPETGC